MKLLRLQRDANSTDLFEARSLSDYRPTVSGGERKYGLGANTHQPATPNAPPALDESLAVGASDWDRRFESCSMCGLLYEHGYVSTEDLLFMTTPAVLHAFGHLIIGPAGLVLGKRRREEFVTTHWYDTSKRRGALNGANGEFTGKDDTVVIGKGGQPGGADKGKIESGKATQKPVANKAPKMAAVAKQQEKEKVSFKSTRTIDAMLSDLDGVKVEGSLAPPALSTQEDRKRAHKSASRRVYNKKHNEKSKDSKLVPDQNKGPAAKAEDSDLESDEEDDSVLQPINKELPEIPKVKTWDLSDAQTVKLFVKVDADRLQELWTYGSIAMNAATLGSITLAPYVGIVSALLYGVFLMGNHYWNTSRVDTKEWETDTSVVYPLTALKHTREVNLNEVNAMAYSGYNAFRVATISKEVLSWLERSKATKPSAFSQQQFTDIALKQFGDYVPVDIIYDTAARHNQKSISRFHMFALQSGNVKEQLERL